MMMNIIFMTSVKSHISVYVCMKKAIVWLRLLTFTQNCVAAVVLNNFCLKMEGNVFKISYQILIW